MEIKNVLSLFDGMSCGQIALNRAGIKYKNYAACEVDKYAMKITQKNYPDTRQMGDVTKIHIKKTGIVDLLIGGSPCQGFSFAGKQLNFDDPRSKLFFEYVRILKEAKPKYFLLENVKMKKEFQDIISQNLGVAPIEINSALVSAQNRKRLFWTNIPGVNQPKDRGLLLRDILEDGSNKVGRMVGRKLNPKTGKRDDYNKNIKAVQRIEPRLDNKCGTLTTVQKDNYVLVDFGKYNPVETKNYYQFDVSGKGYKSQQDRAYKLDCKFGCFPNARAITKRKIALNGYIYRDLTLNECESLQTVPYNYTKVGKFSLNKSLCALGNGWTVDVIAHILKGIK